MSNDLNLVALRRSEIDREIATLTARIEELRAELPDLDIAERVLARLSGIAGHAVGESDAEPETAASSAKPEGIPTVPEMINAVLLAASGEGLRGLEPREIAQRIARQWWPDVKSETIASVAWRMWKRNQLYKNGPVYTLPDPETNKGPDVGASEPSEVPSSQSEMRPEDLI